MRFRYDPVSGALYFRVLEGEIEETVELPTPGSYVDVGRGGRVMGLEFLSVHEFLAFLVASGGEAQIPERVDPDARDLGRAFRGRRQEGLVKGEAYPAPESPEESVASGAMRRALENALRVIENASSLAEARHDLEDLEERLAEAASGPVATEAARREAEELGVDLSQVEGSGSGGQILVRDVRRSAAPRR